MERVKGSLRGEIVGASPLYRTMLKFSGGETFNSNDVICMRKTAGSPRVKGKHPGTRYALFALLMCCTVESCTLGSLEIFFKVPF